MRKLQTLRSGWCALALVAVLFAALPVGLSGSPTFDNPAFAQAEGEVPGNTLGNRSDSEFWRAVRRGQAGTVSIPDQNAATLVQSEGENWRAWRNGPLSVWGAWAMLGVIALLALFFVIRGRIRIDAGESGQTIERFNGLERFAHWLTAVSFVILGLTGLNILYGRIIIQPLFGKEFLAWITGIGKIAHNYVAFAFMAGIVLIVVIWIRHNVPNRHDMVWLAKGGGMFAKGVHPPARKFNAGQKILFWLVVLGGISISLSGLALLFPFQIAYFGKTFAVLNVVGLGLPTDLTMLQEMQLSQLWHIVVGIILIALIIGHIYIGTIGMQGAFDAMGNGKVDVNWAKEHHNIWVSEMEGKAGAGDD